MLNAAHRGYNYQDLLVAIRLVDVLLDSITAINVDEKLVRDFQHGVQTTSSVTTNSQALRSPAPVCSFDQTCSIACLPLVESNWSGVSTSQANTHLRAPRALAARINASTVPRHSSRALP